MTKQNPSPNWGGKRPGAGRQPTGRKQRCLWLSDAELTQVKELIQKMRNVDEK